MRLKALAACCAALTAAVCASSGCSSQEPYSPPEPTPTVSSPAIGQDGVLRVGVNSSAAPLAGTNSAGDLVGYDVDLAAALADELGLKVEVVDVGATFETALEDGDVDVVLGVEEGSASKEVWESDPYLQTAVALFSDDANAQVPTADSSPVIAVQTSSTSSWMAENEFGAEALERVSGLSEAFETMASGGADYVAADAVRGVYAQSGSEGSQATIVALMQQPSGYCIALLDSNTELKQAVADALSSLVDGGMVNILNKKWLGQDWNLDGVPLTAGATATPTDKDAEGGDSADAEADGASEGDAADGGSDTAGEGDVGENALSPSDLA